MPHQPVFRDESLTTKMRIVFDASSSRSFQHLSWNDCLWPGPNLNSNIFDSLINFRLNKFAFISDSEKGLLQLTLAEKDRDAVHFLWTENDTLQVYRFNRVLFGVGSSPFLLSASIKTHLKKFHDEFPTTTECLNRCFYVDDFISGADSLQDALEISTQAVSIMDQASMVLRKWTTNSDELRQLWIREGLENQLQVNPISPRANSTKVLGMLWNTVEDYLIVGTQSLVDSLSNNENTERHLLRAIGKIFDPLGLLSQFTIRVKCMLQVLWMKEISWDEELPPDIQKTWCKWLSEVPLLSELHIPRYVLSSSTGEPTDVLELHCFCYASQKAYGVVIYTRVVKDCNVEVNLLVSKSRVAPLTKITMPRLELMGALLADRLASKVKPIVDLKRPSKVFFWTDSKITLHWIKGSNESGILRVGDRLKYSDLSLDEKHPIVLPDKHPLTLIIVSENIEWKFIPPKSPDFGGLWEAGVKSFKHHLKRVIGNAQLTLEEFLTIILEIESVLNSRPLTPLSTEFDNFETLSPGHFLIGRPLTSFVEPTSLI
ncbi:hypothetical protein AVEN_25289-1 [Araneus ventricosus]|uniref:Reverse transcriptase domain-containing protein n=1 Tax=Araneus ventricosus TaxID=182803 RepID=A0A4Y2LBL4_ARAVE|nr:hypothetical protein AVEN_25289-1 [Araneus ventricosus]